MKKVTTKLLGIVLLTSALMTNAFADCGPDYRVKINKLSKSRITPEFGLGNTDAEELKLLGLMVVTTVTGGIGGLVWGAVHGLDKAQRKIATSRLKKARNLIYQAKFSGGSLLKKCAEKADLSMKETAKRIQKANKYNMFCGGNSVYSYRAICKFVKDFQ